MADGKTGGSQSLDSFLDMNRLLRHYLNDRLQLSQEVSKKAIKDTEPVIKLVLEKVKAKDPRFDMEIKYRGSYYEKVKIKEADEFDIDLCIKSLQVEAPPNGRPQGATAEYTLYKLEGTNIDRWRNLASKDGKNYLSAQQLVAVYSNLVTQAVDEINKEKATNFL